MAAFALLWCLLCVGVFAPAAAAAPDDAPAEEAADPAASIEDPRRLNLMARAALQAGDVERARALFTMRFERMEIRKYLKYRRPLLEALVHERLGEVDEAAALYRDGFDDDVLRVVQVLRILSRHPERDALVEEAYDWVRARAEEAKAGGKPPIYVTSKGDVRRLEKMTTRELLGKHKGEARYCYIEDLDLSEVDDADLPEVLHLNRCVIGRFYAPEKAFQGIVLKGFVLGDMIVGKHRDDKGNTVEESTFDDLVMRDAVFMGEANFAGIQVTGRRAYWPMAVFEGEADFKGAELRAVTDFRFASFGSGANFRLMRMHEPVYFGGSRYRDDTYFTQVFSERDVYFNSMVFEGSVSFDGCEWQRGATFENSLFGGPANFGTTKITRGLNLSRARFHGPVNVKDVKMGSLDAMGTHFFDEAVFMDATIEGRARFSLDEVTRHAMQEHLDDLLPLYRHYQGDEDADEPLTRQSSYGVSTLEDLTARIDKDISFANTVFGGYTVYEGVTFGTEGETSVANFFNAQFRGETHFERTLWHSKADFTTIFGNEVAFNQAHFHQSLVLDDAAVQGRLTLTDATFADDADLSAYGAEIASFQVSPSQVAGVGEPHRLFYERCALGRIDRDDVRFDRVTGVEQLSDVQLREVCYDMAIDELVMLKDSYGDRAMTAAEDDAYWWSRHHEAMKELRFGTLLERLNALVTKLLIFELSFGWGVRLGNLGIAVIVVTVVYAGLYRWLCPDTVLAYDGEDFRIAEVSFLGLCFVSLQSLIAINTGWDFGDDDHRFRFLNTSETLIGFIILTFFVGAYTRMILA
jgi:uncharacterized protein YjbI with pentapeptide repeats